MSQLFALLALLAAALAPNVDGYALHLSSTDELRTYFTRPAGDPPIVAGHRGGASPEAGENSIEMFEKTLRNAPAIFEVDPHLTSDGQIVLMHDETVDRTTTGSGRVDAMTLAEITSLGLRGSTGEAVQGHPVSAADAIEWARDRTVLNFDMKDVPAADRVALVVSHDALAHVIFTVHTASQAREILNAAPDALLSVHVLDQASFTAYEQTVGWDNVAMGYVGPALTSTAQSLIDALHKRDVPAMIGTSPSIDQFPSPELRQASYRDLITAGVDVIESDRPVEVFDAIKDLYPANSRQSSYWTRPEDPCPLAETDDRLHRLRRAP